MKAARRKLRLFKPWPHITLEDLTQDALRGILTANYDVSRSAWGSFCYQVASRRILDTWDSCRCRGMQMQLSQVMGEEDAETRRRGDTGRGGTTLIEAVEAVPYPMAGRVGRPWKEPLALRIEILRRRRAGESYGSIAQRLGLERYRVQQLEKSVAKFQSELFRVEKPHE